jgi:probable HAF family extracellular repeat protein
VGNSYIYLDWHLGGNQTWGAVYSNGSVTAIQPYTGQSSSPNAINDQGTIVGQMGIDWHFGGGARAYRYSNGTMTDLLPSSYISSANGINNSGTIVGTADGRAFSYSNGTVAYLSSLGGTTGSANAINGSGTIVGSSLTAGGNQHAYSYINGTITDLGTLGGFTSTAKALNDSGMIVGDSTVSGGTQNAFVFNSNGMTDLNSLVMLNSVTLTDAVAINNIGQIVADGSNGDSYLITPIPEPSTYAAILGLSVLGLTIIRRRTTPSYSN